MNIKTKFDLNDTIYFMYNNKITFDKIEEVIVNKKEDRFEIGYKIKNYYFTEGQVFDSCRECLGYLSNNIFEFKEHGEC